MAQKPKAFVERNFISETMLPGWDSTYKVHLFKLIVESLTSPTSVGFLHLIRYCKSNLNFTNKKLVY